MYKKDFSLIASVFYEQTTDINYGTEKEDAAATDAIQRLSHALANRLVENNHRFDMGRFIKACETGEMRISK